MAVNGGRPVIWYWSMERISSRLRIGFLSGHELIIHIFRQICFGEEWVLATDFLSSCILLLKMLLRREAPRRYAPLRQHLCKSSSMGILMRCFFWCSKLSAWLCPWCAWCFQDLFAFSHLACIKAKLSHSYLPGFTEVAAELHFPIMKICPRALSRHARRLRRFHRRGHMSWHHRAYRQRGLKRLRGWLKHVATRRFGVLRLTARQFMRVCTHCKKSSDCYYYVNYSHAILIITLFFGCFKMEFYLDYRWMPDIDIIIITMPGSAYNVTIRAA